MPSESEAHKALKEIIYKKLRDWYGASIPEYYDESHQLDVYSVTPDGISIYVEVIWDPSKGNLTRDLLIIERATADIIIGVVNPEIIKDYGKRREFEKSVLSKRKTGAYMLPMINGQTVLDNPEYIETELRHVVDLAVDERRNASKEKTPDLDVFFIDESRREMEELSVKPTYIVEKIEKKKGRNPYYALRGIMSADETIRRVIGRVPDPDLVPIRIKLVNNGSIGAEHVRVFLEFPEDCVLHADSEFQGLSTIATVPKRYSGLYPDDHTASASLDRLGNDLTFTNFDPIYVRFPPKEAEIRVKIAIIQEGYPPKGKIMKVKIVLTIKEIKKVVYEED